MPEDPTYRGRPMGHLVQFLKQRAYENAQTVARRKQPATHVLAGGAQIELLYTWDTQQKPVWRLRISRENVFPSDTEMKVFRQAFDVGVFIETRTHSTETRRFGIVWQWSIPPEDIPAAVPA